ncbi:MULTISPECIES: peptidase domain-containing ABC transporter [unclassified Xanthomonas]|uniref:peptidase domain-containing ABC transporter n=1 Tax=unclassified Xanthomonas TaxID=2643310 RepID=UPI0028830D14|nr:MULTISPECIES: peptidase domain-containing ABC transporter [unclassified Xanthomonas]
MKVTIQSEAAECGLACITMVADHHGYGASLRELRHRFPPSLKGATLRQLMQVAQALGLRARPLRLELEGLGQLQLPCILHWNLSHFVVLEDVGTSKATIIDPASGRRTVTIDELSRSFTGVAMELMPGTEFQRRLTPPAVTLRQLTGRVTGIWKALTLLLALSASLQVFVVIAPFFIQWVVDQVLVSADRGLLAILGIGFGLALLLQVGISVLRGWTVMLLSTRLGLQWMGNVFAHLVRLPLEYFQKRHVGDVTSRMSSVHAIQQTLTNSFVEALIDGLMAAVTLTIMLIYSWKLALVTLAAVGLYLGLRLVAYRPLRDGTERQLMAAARQETYLLESIRGIQSIKVAGQESARRATYENLMVDTVNQDVRLARMNLGFDNANMLIFGAERIIVICVGASLSLDSVFTVGMLIAYLAYKEQFAQRISALIDKAMELRMLRLHGERLADIALTEPEPSVGPTPDAGSAPLKVEVRNLCFRYAHGEPWVLDNLTFTIAAGESVAIVGASGCGKTTLVKVMLGLLTPTRGQVLVDGKDIHGSEGAVLRALFGAVMQDDDLFAGSIADNISFFDASHDMARMEAAARLASMHEEIQAMPMGYNGFIGDMGSSLSGGQKQRIILARALYRDPALLFLDEATSHLDVGRERAVSDAIGELPLTCIIVAHRPETIRSADRILAMKDGQLDESGYSP